MFLLACVESISNQVAVWKLEWEPKKNFLDELGGNTNLAT